MSAEIAALGQRLFEQQRRSKEMVAAMKGQAERFAAERGEIAVHASRSRLIFVFG